MIDADGCPKDPTWQINAVRVVHDPVRHRISYQGATLNLFGTPILGLPGLSHPGRQPGRRQRRARPRDPLQPAQRRRAQRALLHPARRPIATPRSRRTSTPMCCRCSRPNIAQLTSLGAFQVRGYVTHGSRLPRQRPGGHAAGRRHPRLYRGQWPLRAEPAPGASPRSGRYVTDRTFMRRYDISPRRPAALVRRGRADHRRQLHLDRRLGVPGPSDHRRRRHAADRPARRSTRAGGSPIRCSAAGSSFRRTASPSSAPRARTASAPSPARCGTGAAITPLGQELVLTAFARGDVYHANDTLLTQTVSYRGEEGWNGRFIGAVAADLKWPFVGAVHGRHPALHAAPAARRLAADRESRHPERGCPRRRSRGFSNLFALNRFPGYDRWEDGVRVTYGFDWAVDLPGISVRTNIGQSYRLDRQPVDPAARHRPFRPLLRHRRPDHASASAGSSASPTASGSTRTALALRRNEIDAAIGGRRTYATIGYLRLDRDIDPAIEDLARPRGDQVRRPRRLRPLLVDLRLDRDRPHRPAGGSALASPTASSRSATGSASSTTTIASSLASPGGATMKPPATPGGGTPSSSGWRCAIWGARESRDAAKLRFSKSGAGYAPAFTGGMMKLGWLPRAAIVLIAPLLSVVAAAQSGAPSGQLNIPEQRPDRRPAGSGRSARRPRSSTARSSPAATSISASR